ncbi:MAG: hypothetical protein Q9166_001238 [cf. Caloplaca sp. 2 TL-2023]
MGPTREAIESFVAFTQEPENVAVEWLKLFDNNVEKATNVFYDDPGALNRNKQEPAWNETHFHTDRTNNGGQPPSFTVHHQDSLRPNVFAPSRPPSRASLQNAYSYNPQGDTQGPDRQLTLQEQEDAELKIALERSTSQTLLAQETGTTAADKPYFGPATAKEILLNPEPQDRSRQPGTPAFLRPTTTGHRLPGFVKILHAIPAAREAMLNRDFVKPEYGHNNEWWDGMAIEYPQIMLGEEDFSAPSKEVIYEGQRLFAFLDETERAYGSSEALAALPGLREHEEDSVIKAFLDWWHDATIHYSPSAPLRDVFYTVGTRSNGSDEPKSDEVNVLGLEINEEQFEPGQTLYDVFDSWLWPSWDGTEVDDQIFLEKVADVLVIRVTRGDDVNEGLEIKIPPVWYADRYHQSRQPQIHKMFAAKTAIKDKIKDLDAMTKKVTKYESISYAGDIRALLDSARQHFDKTVMYYEETKEMGQAALPQERSKAMVYSKIAEELKKISERVDRKRQELEHSKKDAQARLRQLSKLLTEPSDIPEESPHDRYTLRGVCAEPNTVYVQERSRIDTQGSLPDGPAADWQWWKFHYDSNAHSRFSCTKVREIEVLKVAREESPGAILVYASNKAMSIEDKVLPAPLKSFVETDNRAFAAELATSSPPIPISPPNRTVGLSTIQPSNIFRPPPREPHFDDPSTESSLPSYDNYENHGVFSPPPRDRSYDDYIPASLRHDSMDLDEGVEMMERDGGARGGAFGASLGGDGQGYQLGSYEPEIEMEDRDDEVRERKKDE